MYLSKQSVSYLIAFAYRLNFGAIICRQCIIATWAHWDPKTSKITLFALRVSHTTSILLLTERPYIYCFKEKNPTKVYTVEQPLSVGLDVICEY